MKITIDEKVCEKNGLTLQEALLALAVKMNSHEKFTMTMATLIDKEVIVYEPGVDGHNLTQHWKDTMDKIIHDSSKGCEKTDEELLKLAVKVKDIFPQGKMRDRLGRETPYYYRCNKSEVARALKRFFTQYGDYSDEDILDATRRYVASFKGNYTNMRLAKYFIMKNPIKQGEDGNGYVEQISDLLTFIENKGEDREIINDDDWLSNTRN